MVGEAFAGLTAFKALMDTATGLKSIHDATIRDQAVFTLQREILAAQSAQMSLIEQIGQLEADIARFETWDTEKQRYELVNLKPTGSVLAYAIKPAMQGSEPPHHICANCYERRTKSVLQSEFWQPLRCRVLVCHTCGAVLYVDGQPDSEHAKLRPRARA